MPLLPCGGGRRQCSGPSADGEEPLRAATVACVAFAGLVGILLGYDMGVVSAALAPLQQFFEITDDQVELFVGFLSLFALPGCMAGSLLADALGRRAGIAVSAALFLLGNLLMAGAASFTALMTGRAIAGFAMGLTYILAPLYVAEVSPAKLRGLLTSMLEVLTNVGILLGYVSGWACDQLNSASSWRVMLGLGVLPPAAILVGAFLVMLESPRWLASRGRMEEAEAVLGRLVAPAEAKQVCRELRPAAKSAESSDATLLEALASPGILRIIFVGVAVAFFSQATGCEAVIYYSGPILSQAGVGRDDMLRATVLVGCMKTAAVLVGGALVDGWGRRPLLMVSSAGLSLSMALLAVAGHLGWPPAVEAAALCAFVVAFSVGFGPVVYVLNAEIYPQRCRSFGLGLAMGTCRIMSAVVSSSFLSLSRWLTTAGALGLYSGVAAVAFVFIFVAVPETKGTTLEAAEAAVHDKANTIGVPEFSTTDAPGSADGLVSDQGIGA